MPSARSSTLQMLSLALVAATIAGCMVAIDRPLALWSNTTLFHSPAARVAELILRPLDPLLLLGATLAAGALIWRTRRAVPGWLNRLLRGMVATAIALAVAVLLKYSLGRSQVYPPFLRDRIYEFHLFHGSRDFGAFPSATMAGASAFLIGAGVWPRLWVVAAMILVLLAAALIAANGHWLSDIIGGTYLGSLVGAVVRRRASGELVAAAP